MSEVAKQYSAIGQLIDADTVELIPYLKELPLGQLCNIKKMLEAEYQRVETTKNALTKSISKEVVEEDTLQDAEDLLNQLYIALQRIEDRCTIVEQLKAKISPKH